MRDAFYASPLFPRLLNAESVKDTIAKGVTEGILAYVGKKGHGQYEPFIFKKPLAPADVEISDDVFIVQAEEAQKHIEPQKLSGLLLFPDQISLQPGARMQFRVEGRDQHERPMAAGKIGWTAAGGKVEANGSFVAGEAEGEFTVEVASGDVKTSAHVTIAKQVQPKPEGLFKKAATDAISTLQWTGQVPSAKWMTFYTKVIAKYAKEKGLTLKASFTISPEQGLTKQQVDEIRAALRELGLNDEVGTV